MRFPFRHMLFLAAFGLWSCERQQVDLALSSSLADSERMKLNEALDRLEKTLKEKAPQIHARLGDGAGEEEIQHLRESLGGQSVEVLERWYGWHNGSKEGEGPAFLLPIGFMRSIEESLHDREMIRKIPMVDRLRRNSIKILEDGAGDGYFLDITSPEPLVFYHMLEDQFFEYFGTLPEFCGFIADAFESGAIVPDPDVFLEVDDEKFDALEEAFLKKATKR